MFPSRYWFWSLNSTDIEYLSDTIALFSPSLKSVRQLQTTLFLMETGHITRLIPRCQYRGWYHYIRYMDRIRSDQYQQKAKTHLNTRNSLSHIEVKCVPLAVGLIVYLCVMGIFTRHSLTYIYGPSSVNSQFSCLWKTKYRKMYGYEAFWVMENDLQINQKI